MAGIWMSVISAVQSVITMLAAATGGSIGIAIVIVSVAVRVALLPLTIRMARRALAQREILARIQPELERLKERFADDPQRLAAETLAFYKEQGISMFDAASVRALVLQLPVIWALYGAIARGIGAGRRFLWIKDLAKPDLLLVAITAALTWFTTLLGAPKDATKTAAAISAVLTVIIMWRVSAALGLYWASSTVVGAVQGFLVRRPRR